jgi:hypothetical protein
MQGLDLGICLRLMDNISLDISARHRTFTHFSGEVRMKGNWRQSSVDDRIVEGPEGAYKTGSNLSLC